MTKRPEIGLACKLNRAFLTIYIYKETERERDKYIYSLEGRNAGPVLSKKFRVPKFGSGKFIRATKLRRTNTQGGKYYGIGQFLIQGFILDYYGYYGPFMRELVSKLTAPPRKGFKALILGDFVKENRKTIPLRILWKILVWNIPSPEYAPPPRSATPYFWHFDPDSGRFCGADSQ